MTIHTTPRDVLSSAFKPKLGKAIPPPRFTEDDSLLVDIRDKIARAQNKPHLHAALVSLLGDALAETRLEHISRTHPGMIGTLSAECEFAKIE
jgi:hypothetical protein